MVIEGMTCAACAKAVERVTKKLPGVVESNVNIATEKLKIVYEPSLTDIADIKRVISKAGYKALEIEEGKKEESNKAERESKSLWKRFIISLIFTAPLLYISMGHMMGLHLPSIIDPMISPLNFGIVQLLLVVPVMYTGRRFYVNGSKALKLMAPNMDSLISIGTLAAVLYLSLIHISEPTRPY